MNKKFLKFLTGVLALCLTLSSCNVKEENIYDDNELTITADDIAMINEELEEELNMTIDSNDESYLILSAIMNNDNLTKEEKELFYNLFYVVEDNDKYINKEELYKNWINIDIKYPNKKINESLCGIYYINENCIKIYDNKESTKNHEGIHSVFTYSPDVKYYSRSISEGVPELINKEYCSDDPFVADDTYIYEMVYVKMLCDIVGKDKVLEAFAKKDLTVVSKAMAKCGGSEEDALNVLLVLEDTLDKLNEMENGGSVVLSYSFDEIGLALSKLDDYYIINMKDLSTFDSYVYNRDLFGIMFYGKGQEGYLDFIKQNGVLEKAYLSSELMNEYPNTNIVSYEDRTIVEVKKFIK